MYQRPHHRQIAQILGSLDVSIFRQHACWFGGGTAIVLLSNEYRESVDIDFLVSDLERFRALRHLLGDAGSLGPLLRVSGVVEALSDIRSDQYGIRTRVGVGDVPVKFEIVFEARIDLDVPADAEALCGMPRLSLRDLAATKLLANADRFADEGVFQRDLIDLAMLECPTPTLRSAAVKAEGAYGGAIRRDLGRAINRLTTRDGWLERCLEALAFRLPRALLWERIRRLEKALSH